MDDDLVTFFSGLIGGVFIGITILSVLLNLFSPLYLNQSTADTICQNLAGDNVTYHAVSEEGKLVCEKPSFDNTQNIVFRNNRGKE